jgi:hypothetical protein
MKKQFYLLASAIMLFSVFGCEKNNGGSDNATEVKEKVTANVTYSIYGGEDELTVFTISATYTDAAGKEATEAVSKLPWSKKVENVAVPFTASLKIVYAKKADIPEQDTYSLGQGRGIHYTTTDGQNANSDVSVSNLTIAKDKLDDYIKQLLDKAFEYKEDIKEKK